jgi:hypothetical protein
MQTAVGAFGKTEYDKDNLTSTLMVENGGGSTRPGISLSGSPPFLAVELCREHLVRSRILANQQHIGIGEQ